jgi:hypothetical protein
MIFSEWLKDFSRQKKYLGKIDQPITGTLYGIERYIDYQGALWEYGFTYTNRLVVRSGILDAKNRMVTWSEWQTQHHVIIFENQR